jgi:phosphatidylinositol kinase/protein kinase (PI-3  family)
MCDAMGPTSYEGVFRGSLEATLKVLRAHAHTFTSVLEPFLRDPTVGWGRGGRAQRSGGDSGRERSRTAVGDVVNSDAEMALKRISDRLRGIVVAFKPKTSVSAGKPTGGEFQALPLSVQGQVDRLIQEAIAVENLAQMFVGWMPWM